MPELRQNYATKEWVIIASERAKRPSSYVENGVHKLLTEDRPEYDPNCPFCVGNEELDLQVENFPPVGPWKTRVVRNKYPALSGDGLPVQLSDGVHASISGVGRHEVLVEHPRHNTTLALIDPEHIQLVLETFQQRGKAMSEDPRIKQIIFFKNHGERAGASLAHPHCQIIGMPVVPDTIRRRMLAMQQHVNEQGENPIQVMLEEELQSGERLINVSEHFVAFVLYAGSSPFHSWIVPRRPQANFLDVPPAELADLAVVLRDMLRRIYYGLNDPDYNLIIRSSPLHEPNDSHFHWYIAMVPRLSRVAGFEMGSGMYINPSLPESCAAFLRDVRI
ncbi:MAG: galactose-1-phosphate uridylyltransferase [Chloroflexaceae bacterium]|nr:galactose-1-phosphate uridylyltransferase [Chloroflexaceae bacterium]NJO05793.1 galactose-1-phosphate uridylyltransferase [Chloroflexaceae bacterium]